MRFLSERRSRGPVINVTSLLDVMFLLVIFVLLSAKFEPEGGIAVDLPQGASAEVPRTRTVTVTIAHDGTLFFDKERVTVENLPGHIAALREAEGDPIMVIRADRTVPWERVVRVTDLAKQSGQRKVNFQIRP